MSKALMLWGPSGGIASGRWPPLYGGSASTITEVAASCTEAATFSGLAYRVVSGGSGTNNLFFRVNGANGNQLASIAGTGLAVDASNTDVLAAGDLFGGSVTDTGTDPAVSFIRCNIEFASGHGNIHGGFGAAVLYDVPGPRYIALGGTLGADGAAAVAAKQWLVRGYSSIEALQLQVTTNARVNNSVFSVNINGSDVGTAVTVGAGLTGIFSATGMGISVAPGDLVAISITLGAGTEDINLSIVAATFKSTAGKSEVFGFDQTTGLVRAASATPNYIAPGGRPAFVLPTTDAECRVKVGFACRITNLRSYLVANTCTGDQTVKVFVNGAAAITLTIAAAAASWQENSTDVFEIDADDEVSLEFLGGTSGSATFASVGFTMEPLPMVPASSELDHETENVALTNNLVAIDSEFDYEAQSEAITQAHELAPDASNDVFESGSSSLTQEHILSADSGEFDHEIESLSLVTSSSPSVDSSEYEYENQSASISSTSSVSPSSSGFGSDYRSVALAITDDAGFQCEVFQDDAFQNDCDRVDIFPFEFGWEAKSVGLTSQHLLGADSFEYGWESSVVGMTQIHNLGLEEAEFAWETVSVPTKIFRHGRTPTHRRRYVIE